MAFLGMYWGEANNPAKPMPWPCAECGRGWEECKERTFGCCWSCRHWQPNHGHRK